jgi:hypothetical protein
MKQTKMYEAPKMEVIELGTQGVLCASIPEPVDFTGTGMTFTTDGGNW